MEKHMIWSKEEFRTPRRYEIILVALAACGAENDLPVLIRPGMKFHCTECGAELEI